jgi:hypothetical protein
MFYYFTRVFICFFVLADYRHTQLDGLRTFLDMPIQLFPARICIDGRYGDVLGYALHSS